MVGRLRNSGENINSWKNEYIIILLLLLLLSCYVLTAVTNGGHGKIGPWHVQDANGDWIFLARPETP